MLSRAAQAHARAHARARARATSASASVRALASSASNSAAGDSLFSVPPDPRRSYHENVLNVPRLPLPEVKATMTRYVETLEPLLSSADLERNRRLAAEFADSDVAKKLQAGLRGIVDAKETYPYHYFETSWDDMYYGGRWPLMVHVNPFFAFPAKDANPRLATQARRAAGYATSMAKWWRKVVENRLEPDTEKGKALDGFQYPLVFGVERVPHETRDLFIAHAGASKHIIVLHRHRYYRVDVINHEGAVLSEDALSRIFERILDDRGATAAEDVGLLTSGDRTHLAKARHEMIRVSPTKNGPSWKDLDTSLFVVVLEDSSSDSLLERGRQYLHGVDGSNRYWDKHQLIVHSDGALGMCLEHGCNDGMTWYRMLHEVFGDLHPEYKTGFSPLTTKEVSEIDPVGARPLVWDFRSSPHTAKHIQESADAAKALVDDVDSAFLNITKFNRETFKGWKVSPDAAVQMAFQLAYARVNPTLGMPATYESCSMKSYFHGRTETIRSCTSESKAMVKAFNAPSSTPQERREALAKACEKHVNVAGGARSCSGPNIGVDRHMLGLRAEAARQGVELPAVFKDPAFSKSNTWILSTSNVTAPFFDCFGFGAVSELGYGLGYMTGATSVPIYITSFFSGQAKTPGKTGSKVLADAINGALQDFAQAHSGK